MKNTSYICEHCGAEAEEKIEIEIFHRSCRLKAIFPNSYEVRDGLLVFDPDKMFQDANKELPNVE